MATFKYLVIIVIAFLIHAANSDSFCMSHYESAKVEEVMANCNKKLGADAPPAKASAKDFMDYYEKIEKDGFEDKCVMKCFVDEFGLIDDKFQMNLDKFDGFIKSNATENTKKKVLSDWKICLEKSNKEMPGNEEKNLCKKFGHLDVCLFKLYEHQKPNCA